MNAEEIRPELDSGDFEESLNEEYGSVSICGIDFDAGTALKELDRSAFDSMLSDYESDMDSSWECGNCGNSYDNEDEAEDCCKHACPNCGDLFEDEDDAMACCHEDDEADDEGEVDADDEPKEIPASPVVISLL